MDIAPALLPAKMPQIEGDISPKRDGVSFKKILITEASDPHPAEETEMAEIQTASPRPEQVTNNSPAITEESITAEDSTLHTTTSEEESSSGSDSEKGVTLSTEAYSDPPLPSPPPVNTFEYIKMTEPAEPRLKEASAKGKAKGKAKSDAKSEAKGKLTTSIIVADSTLLTEVNKKGTDSPKFQTSHVETQGSDGRKILNESSKVSDMTVKAQPVQTKDIQNSYGNKNKASADSPVNKSSLPFVVDGGGEQTVQSSGNRGAGIYQVASSVIGNIQESFQKKKLHLSEKRGKTEERPELTTQSPASKDGALENEKKTPVVNHLENYMDKEFSRQKPGDNTPGLNRILETHHKSGTDTPGTEKRDETAGAGDLNDQKQFPNLSAYDKHDAEISQNTRKTAGYLFRKIESFIKTGKSEFSLKLYPETLGTLQIKVNSDGDLLKIHMTAQNHISKNVIESTLNELKSSLTEKGFQTDQLSVSVGRDGSFSNSGNSNMNNGSSNLRGASFRSSPENDLARENVSALDNKREIVSSVSNVNIFV